VNAYVCRTCGCWATDQRRFARKHHADCSGQREVGYDCFLLGMTELRGFTDGQGQPVEVKPDYTPAERYMAHISGYKDGATRRAMDPKYHYAERGDIKAAYDAGYTRGYEDFHRYARRVQKLTGYEPTIVRTCG
jgi:hypothetical protein